MLEEDSGGGDALYWGQKKREALGLPLVFSSTVSGFLCSLLPLREKGWG